MKSVLKNKIFSGLINKYSPYNKIIKTSSSSHQNEYNSWKEALHHSTGYDSVEIVQKVTSSLLKVKSGKAVYERDSVLFDKIIYSWPLLATLLWVSSINKNSLNVIDFGGSLGTTYFQNRKMLSYVKSLRWNIIEQPEFVKAGKKYFENSVMKFYTSFDNCLKENRPNIVILSGIIQYLEKPYRELAKIFEFGIDYLIIDRLSFIQCNNDIIRVEKVPKEIYEASYPSWLFNKNKFEKFIWKYCDIVTDFDAIDQGYYFNSKPIISKGYILTNKLVKH